MIIDFAHEVFHELARRLGQAPKPRVWALAESRGFISDVLDQESDSPEQEAALERLVTFALPEKVERWSEGTQTEREFWKSHGTRLDALARILAAEARGWEIVRDFRREILRGRLVAPERERIDAWLKRRETRDRGTAYAEVTLTEDGQVDRILKREWRTVLGFRVLHDGAIGRLRTVADALRQRFPWSEYQTVQFVLCDTVPRVASLTGTISPANPPLEAHFGRQGIPWFTPSLDRISVKVPPTTSPKVVMSFFADLRRSYYEVEEDGRVPGIQKLSEKHAELAVFAFEHNDGRPWREALSAWNETHEAQGWDYSDEKPFARDSRAAYKTVTGRDLGWESGRGPNKRR